MKAHLLSLVTLLALPSSLVACNGLTGIDDLIVQSGGAGGGAGGSRPEGSTSAAAGTTSSAGAGGSASSTSSSTSAVSSSSSTSAVSSSSSTSSGGVCQYPPGAYGISTGKTVAPNLTWQGYREQSNQVEAISINDYFDCDGSKGVTALLILQSATWCGVCQQEASELDFFLPAWGAKGIRVITLMIEDQDGFPASTGTALAWKNAFGLTGISVAADPNFSFAPPGSVGLPLSIVVDPRTMKIVTTEEGYSGDYSALEQVAQKNAH